MCFQQLFLGLTVGLLASSHPPRNGTGMFSTQTGVSGFCQEYVFIMSDVTSLLPRPVPMEALCLYRGVLPPPASGLCSESPHLVSKEHFIWSCWPFTWVNFQTC